MLSLPERLFRTSRPRFFGLYIFGRWQAQPDSAAPDKTAVAAPNRAGVEGGGGQLFVTLQLACDHFCGHMRFVHGFVGKHRLADDVTNRKNMRHVGAHLNIHIDEATVGDGDTGFVSGDLFAIGRATHGL
jgi:hypothetical protein